MSETINNAIAPGGALKQPRRSKAPTTLLPVPAALASQFPNPDGKVPGRRPRTRAPSTVPPVPAALVDVQMVSKEVVMATFGWRSPSAMYEAIQNEQMVDGIHLSTRCSRWLVREVMAVAAARAAGATQDELRALVRHLRMLRQIAKREALDCLSPATAVQREALDFQPPATAVSCFMSSRSDGAQSPADRIQVEVT